MHKNLQREKNLLQNIHYMKQYELQWQIGLFLLRGVW